MEIPYTVTARPDTGLYNAKLGIWLFLASEVMLFGGLFSAYIFMRMSADPGYWPTGLLNVPVGTANTIILIASSVTVILAWASLKMRQWSKYVLYMWITIICSFVFLGVKLLYEWPDKFHHFGVYIKNESAEKYDKNLGNHPEGKPAGSNREITGHLHGVELDRGGQHTHEGGEHFTPAQLDNLLKAPSEIRHRYDRNKDGQIADEELAKLNEDYSRKPEGKIKPLDTNGDKKLDLAELNAPVRVLSYELDLDAVSADPLNPKNQGAAFLPRQRPGGHENLLTVKSEDVASASAFYPRHNTFFSTYFLITGLHGLHVLGGALVFCYMLFFGKKLYKRNPEHLANRVEVAGLFWHFVDLVWIFVFPIFYLL